MLTLSPGILFGLTPLMMQTASMTSRTPSGGRCIARTSTTSFLLRDLRLASAASCSHTAHRLHVRKSYSFSRSCELTVVARVSYETVPKTAGKSSRQNAVEEDCLGLQSNQGIFVKIYCKTLCRILSEINVLCLVLIRCICAFYFQNLVIPLSL